MTRARLPNRRVGFAVDFEVGAINADFTVMFALLADGRCAELFLNVRPSLGSLEKDVRDAAILASLALQHGATLDELIASVTHEEDGSASSIIGTALIAVRDEIGRLDGGPTRTTPGGSPSGSGGADAARPAAPPSPIPGDLVSLTPGHGAGARVAPAPQAVAVRL